MELVIDEALLDLAYETLRNGAGDVLAVAHHEHEAAVPMVIYPEGDVLRGYGVRNPTSGRILRQPFFLDKDSLFDWLAHLEILAIIHPPKGAPRGKSKRR